MSWNSGCSAASSAWARSSAPGLDRGVGEAGGRQRALQLGEALDAAQAAAGAPGERAAAFAHGGEAFAGERHAHLAAEGVLDDVDVVEFACARGDALAEREAEREVFEVLRGGEHDRVGEAVIDEGDRRLFGDRILAEDRGVGAPAFDAVAAVRPACGVRVVEHGDLLSGRSRKRVVPRLDSMIQKNIKKSNYNVSQNL